MRAYLLIRPAIIVLRRVAAATDLSATTVVFRGVSLGSVPLRCAVAFDWEDV